MKALTINKSDLRHNINMIKAQINKKIDKLIKIADFLNTTTDYLLERTNIDSPLSVITNNIVDEQLNELINNYARLNKLQRQEVNLYVTGLTVSLISVLNAFKVCHIKVNLYHFDRDTNTYFKKEVLRRI